MAYFSTFAFCFANLSLILLFIFLFQKKYIPHDLQNLFRLSLAWKLLLTIVGVIFFTYYFPYRSDPRALFQASLDLRAHLENYPEKLPVLWNGGWDAEIDYSGIPRAFFLVKVLFYLNLLTGGVFLTDSIWLSLAMFFSGWLLCLEVKKRRPSSFIPSLFALLFMPTTVFWSSGILKEALGLCALCLLTCCFLNALDEKSLPWKQFLWAILPCYLLLSIRFFVLGAFLWAAVPFYITFKYKQRLSHFPLGQLLLFAFLFVMTCFLLNWMCQITMKANLAELTFYTYEVYATRFMADYEFPLLSTSFDSLWAYIPKAIWYGLFCPQIWQSVSALSFGDSLANATVLILFLFCLIDAVKRRRSVPFYAFPIMLYVVISAVFVSISSPNFGSLARYKTMYMPFLHHLIFAYLFKLILQSTTLARFLAYFSVPKKGHS